METSVSGHRIISLQRFQEALNKQVSIVPLVVLRIAFGLLMMISVIRFVWKGWVYTYYIAPVFHFHYYGFEWVQPLGELGMYALFICMGLAAFGILVGAFYRISSIVFFVCFTYVELIDQTTYLNHYYFVSLISFLLLWVPAHRYFAWDVRRKPESRVTTVPAWTILLFKFQMLILYFYAGLAKLNYDWLMEAQPLRTWLPERSHLPLIGPLLEQVWVAYAFSWIGMVFDLCIGFVLFNRKTVYIGYFFVWVFHVFTSLFFQIGMFPYIMMTVTLVFFPDSFHQGVIRLLQRIVGNVQEVKKEVSVALQYSNVRKKIAGSLLALYFVLQLLVPFRYLLYPGELFWTEEGFRFSWRVMLMEKTGLAFFYVKDSQTGVVHEVPQGLYLTNLQAFMMRTQPDMILQYAHFLGNTYRNNGVHTPEVYTDSYVSLNGAPSQRFIDSKIDLMKERESFRPKAWILPYVHPKFAKCD